MSSTRRGLRPYFLSSFSKTRRPISTAPSFCWVLSHCRILLLAREVATKLSQSREGLREGLVMISTRSPFDSGVRSGTSLPLTRAPAQWCPSSVCTL